MIGKVILKGWRDPRIADELVVGEIETIHDCTGDESHCVRRLAIGDVAHQLRRAANQPAREGFIEWENGERWNGFSLCGQAPEYPARNIGDDPVRRTAVYPLPRVHIPWSENVKYMFTLA